MDIGNFLTKIYAADTHRASASIKKMYSTYSIPKRHGSREINSPNKELKEMQRWVYSHILAEVELPDCVHGFRKKHGIKTNANPHLGKKYVSCLDIKDFFPSITKNQVRVMFQELEINNKFLGIISKPALYNGYLFFDELIKPTYSEILSTICTFKDSLPQGTPTSPVISNIIFSKIDREIIKICEARNITYTRYADDVTFSCNNKKELQKSVHHIKSIINSSGFKINPKKTRMMNGQGATIVTGLRLNANKLSIGNKRKKLLRAKIFNWIMQDDIREKEHIQGELAYLKSIEEDTYVRFKSYIEKLKKKKHEMPEINDGEYNAAQVYIRNYYAIMNKYSHRPMKIWEKLDTQIDGLIDTLLNESYPIRKFFVDKICNFLETKKRIIYVKQVKWKNRKIHLNIFCKIIRPVLIEELAHNNAKYIKWMGQLQEEAYNYRGSDPIYLYFLEMSFRIDKNQKTLRLLFREKWNQIFSDITENHQVSSLAEYAWESDDYDELLTEAERDYAIFNQYYVSSGHLSAACEAILEQWKFITHHLRAYKTGKSEGVVGNFRDYTIRNELLDKSKKLKRTFHCYDAFCLFLEIIITGNKRIEFLFAKLEEYKSRIKDGLTNSDFDEIMKLAGIIYDMATMSEKERLNNTIDLMNKEMKKTAEK